VFVGYPYGKKGWRLYDCETEEFFISRDVVFCEDQFPFDKSSSSSASPVHEEEEELWASFSMNPLAEIEDRPDKGKSPLTDSSPSSLSSPDTNIASSSSTSLSTPPSTSSDSSSSPPTSTTQSDNSDQGLTTLEATSNSTNPVPPSSNLLGRGKRPKIPSVRLNNYVVNTAHGKLLNKSGKTQYPIANYVSCTRFSETHRVYLAAITENIEPKSFKSAMENERWKKAMGTEVGASEENETWTLENLPPGKRAIGSKWVYKIKYNSDGTIERYKARLVALGNKQIEGEDYGETFAPVAKMGTVRLFLKVAAGNDWPVYQMDVYNAFLHGDLEEEVYMKPPPGFYPKDEQKVCRLRKLIYGLTQAPRCWFEKLTSSLRDYGFQQTHADYSLFTFDRDGIQIRLLIYVDDMILTGNNDASLEEFKVYLSSCFKMKDLGPLKYFLGIEVSRNKSGFYLSQRKYALDIVTETDMLASKPASFPLEQNHQLALSTSPLLVDPSPYRRLIGRFIYLATTRPDLAFCVHTLAQFMQQPREDHWHTALHVVRYIKGTAGQGILLSSANDFKVNGWCDSDWSSCPITRRSVTGYFVQLGQSPISWKTKKQDTVSK